MVRPDPRGKRIHFGAKTYPTVIGEILHIGDHPSGYSMLQHVIVAIDNRQAIEAIKNEWRVRIAPKYTKFLGKVQAEHLLYLVLDIPKNFDMDKIGMWRLEAYLSGSNMASIEIVAQHWETDDFTKSGTKLYLKEIHAVQDEQIELEIRLPSYLEEQREEIWEREGLTSYRSGYKALGDTRSGFEVLKDIEKTVFNDYETYVQSQRDKCMPVLSRHRWIQHMGLQREYDQRNNRKRTVWEIGDVMSIDGLEYVIGVVSDLIDCWSIRLDRKREPSRYLRVPK